MYRGLASENCLGIIDEWAYGRNLVDGQDPFCNSWWFINQYSNRGSNWYEVDFLNPLYFKIHTSLVYCKLLLRS